MTSPHPALAYYLLALNSKSHGDFTRKLDRFQFTAYVHQRILQWADENELRKSEHDPVPITDYELRYCGRSPNVALLRSFIYSVLMETLGKPKIEKSGRKRRLLTQRDLAEMYGTDPGCISRQLEKFRYWETMRGFQSMAELKQELIDDYHNKRRKWSRKCY